MAEERPAERHLTAERHRRRPDRRPLVRRLIIGGIAAVVFVVAVGYLASLSWTGEHQSPAALAILKIQIIGGVVPVIVDVLAVVAALFLLVRKPTRRRLVVAGIGLGAGIVVGVVVVVLLLVMNAFGVVFRAQTNLWLIAGFAGIGLAIASFFISKGWRVVGTAATILVFFVAATIGVDTDFGLDPTVGALAGISTEKVLVLPPIAQPSATPTPSLLAGGALWANWTPPAGMPMYGETSQVTLPNSASGFVARAAGLYMPPAALVANPPALPLVIMMMGQPGNPDAEFQAGALNAFEVNHKGLAPIVLVVDQIGNPATDPLCLDTDRYGKVETYITQDVVGWARTHLHILQDAAHWTVAGYSNGGECALYFGAKYPAIWGNVLDISGEKYPGSTVASSTLSTVFHGDSAAYQATWPTNIMSKYVYPDTTGIFTVGSDDTAYRQIAMEVSAAAQAAGWTTTYFEIPNGGHVLGALNGGLTEGYSVLYPRLGLSQPGTVP